MQYVSDQDFTTTIKQKVNSGDAPDIGLFPQPGGILEFAADNKVQPIDTYLDYDAIDRSLVPGFLEAARYKGRVYGAPMRMAVKSIVWYPKPAYTDGKYSTSPASIQALRVRCRRQDRGRPASRPWCIGWESDQATGWVGTDWLEEYMLRMYGPDIYDDWVSHRIPFNDERVVKALDEVAKISKTKGQVLGDTKGILNTAFGDAMTPAFDDPPKCMIMRQGNFVTTFFPKPVLENLDDRVGIYVFPPYEGGYKGQPILGGGDLAALFNGNDPDAQAVAQFLTSDKFGRTVGQGRRLAVAAHDVRRQQLPGRDHQGDGQDRRRRRHLPLRRIGPDAEGRRIGLVLERDGQVAERPVVPGDGRRHRSHLAEVMSTDTTTVTAPQQKTVDAAEGQQVPARPRAARSAGHAGRRLVPGQPVPGLRLLPAVVREQDRHRDSWR